MEARAALLEYGPDLIDTLVPGTALGSHRSGHGRALGTYRSEEVSLGRGGETHPLQKTVDELRRILGTVHIDLDAARETEGMALVDALLDAEPNRLDAAFRQALHEHTGGHPLFVVELLRDLQSDGGLNQNRVGEWIVGPSLNWSALPDRIEGIIAVRMDRLDAEERQLLTTASVGLDNPRGPPFNVQRSLQIPNLTEDEVAEMVHWYERESGQAVEPAVVERLYTQLRGQPGLTSWFGELLTETYNEHNSTITLRDFEGVEAAASNRLPNTNIINLISKANEQPHRDFLIELFQTEEKIAFKYDNPSINYLYL